MEVVVSITYRRRVAQTHRIPGEGIGINTSSRGSACRHAHRSKPMLEGLRSTGEA
jgi:hypothetical protein